MDNARCLDDGVVYTAYRFSKLPIGELSQKRRSLECVECHGPAFFRKKSTSGQAPCFGARPHQPTCSMAAMDSDPQVGSGGGEQDILENEGSRIIVDFNFGPNIRPKDEEDANQQGNNRHGGRFVGEPPHAAVSHRRLSTLLLNLIRSEQFRNSDQIIEIIGGVSIPAKDFFVPFLEVKPSHFGKFRGFWGMIADANRGNTGELWLNSGHRGRLSICVKKEISRELQGRYKLYDDEGFAGSYALILGDYRQSKNGKNYIALSDIGYIALRSRS